MSALPWSYIIQPTLRNNLYCYQYLLENNLSPVWLIKETDFYAKRNWKLRKTINIFQIENEATGVFLSCLIYCSTEVKVSNKNSWTRSEMCSKVATKTSKWCWWHFSGVFLGEFENNSDFVLVCLLFTFSMYLFTEFFPEKSLFSRTYAKWE